MSTKHQKNRSKRSYPQMVVLFHQWLWTKEIEFISSIRITTVLLPTTKINKAPIHFIGISNKNVFWIMNRYLSVYHNNHWNQAYDGKKLYNYGVVHTGYNIMKHRLTFKKPIIFRLYNSNSIHAINEAVHNQSLLRVWL